LAIIASVLVGAENARAASVDCKRPSSRVEHLTCSDTNVRNLGSQIEGAYLGALDRSTHPARVTQDQRAWLKERDACADRDCLIASFKRRIAVLSKVSDPPPGCPGSTTYEMNACEVQYLHRAERQLARYLAVAHRRLLEEARDPVRPMPAKTALSALDTAQKRWLAYRTAECGAVYDWYSDGTIRDLELGACLEDMTDERTEEIWGRWLTSDDNAVPPLLPKPTKR
jgi:uncharacterized protein YecT (DUF1311 family)